MDANPEIASDWKGSILMHISAIENDKPKKGVEDLSDEKKPQKAILNLKFKFTANNSKV